MRVDVPVAGFGILVVKSWTCASEKAVPEGTYLVQQLQFVISVQCRWFFVEAAVLGCAKVDGTFDVTDS